MFGYVKPFIPNLRVKEYEFYKSVYCGLCRSMKKHTGGFSRLSLSYDMTFFALVRLALTGEQSTIRRRRCAVHPVRRRPMMEDGAALAYTAAVSALLVWHKLHDTLDDERGVKRLGALGLLPYASGMRRRAGRLQLDAYTCEAAAGEIASAMEKLAALETAQCASPDEPAEVFGTMLGALLAGGLADDRAMIAQEIGLHTGRWVYLADAICDYEADCKSGSYNPFRYAFAEKEQMAAFRAGAMQSIMAYETDAVIRAVDLIDFEGRELLRACIINIVDEGMESALSIALGKDKGYGKQESL